jgi:very-short-patch-repair endonuclease
MTAVLACGFGAVVSHGSAAALWGIGREEAACTEVSVPRGVRSRPPGLIVHRRSHVLPREGRRTRWISVTSPALTLIDNANAWGPTRLEAAVNEADKLGLTRPDRLRKTAEEYPRLRGARLVRHVLDRRTFQLTDSELERLFLPLVRELELPAPKTRQIVDGYRADFYWPALRLVVETDGLRYHRTAAEQAADRRRDQTHMASGHTPLRFTHAQVRYEPEQVKATLLEVARRLGATA